MTDTSDIRPVVSLADVALADWQHGEKFTAKIGSFGKMLGLEKLGCMLTVVPPGKAAFPFHVHHANDEMFVILAGNGEYRFGDKTYPIKAGSVLGAPAGGQDTAHQIINTGTVPLRYYAISTMSVADVCEYPDSGKFGVFSRSTRISSPRASSRARWDWKSSGGPAGGRCDRRASALTSSMIATLAASSSP